MEPDLFSIEDIIRITSHGLTEAQVREQLRHLQTGATPIRLNRPCRVGDGIISILSADMPAFLERHEREAASGRFMKFVPASGAASRMFKDWFGCMEKGSFTTKEAAYTFGEDIKKFAFCKEVERLLMQRGKSLEELLEQGRHLEVIKAIITSEGLNYGFLPKALLKFHAYPHGSRTAMEEHMVEAVHYVKSASGICRIHFTVSAEHRSAVEAYLEEVRQIYRRQHDALFDIEISVQSAATDTIAVNMQNRPLRDDLGRLVFRPGGHGALLANLMELPDGDIVFIKNIDNVVPDHLKTSTIIYKKVLGGSLAILQEQIFDYLRRIEGGLMDQDALELMAAFCRKKLNIVFPKQFAEMTPRERQAEIYAKLNRPIRICGMVKNEGEPGGAPFWVDETDGTQSLQIVEESQIDADSPQQREIWFQATHFNPVDLVCGIRDFRGQKHDLARFVNHEAFSIVQKTEKGRDLKSLELPGFWNGSMAGWITVFVEVPIDTFNPVKTVYDLLRPAHMATDQAINN